MRIALVVVLIAIAIIGGLYGEAINKQVASAAATSSETSGSGN